MRTTLFLATALLAAACGGGKKTEEAKPGSELKGSAGATGSATASATGSAAPDASKPAGTGTVTVTSKSPDAIKEFEAGRALVEGERGAEAGDNFKKAIELDPDFALAHAYLGIVTPGPPGIAELEKAKTLAAKLPDPERLLIEGAQAGRAGKHADMIADYTKVADLAPGDWHIWISLGVDANDTRDHAKAIAAFEKALKIKPDLAIAQDGLAYGHAGLREWEPAIAAAKKQVELLPKQPNPEDTLGEILLMAGQFDESEKAFQAALDIEPKFNISWQGISLARAYRGDWKGALEANNTQNENAVDAFDSVDTIIDSAWLALASSDVDDAMDRFDVLDKDADAKQTPGYAFSALDRAFILQLAGKTADSIQWLETGRKRGDTLPGFSKRLVQRDHAIGLLRAAAFAAKPAPDPNADKLIAGLDADATAAGDPDSQSHAAWGHGLAAWTKTGPKDAVTEPPKCAPVLLACRYDLAAAQRAAGDAAGADATEKQIRESPLRDARAVYFVTKLSTAKAPPKK